MNQKSFMLKLVTIPLLAMATLPFVACGDNPIEVEDKKQVEFSIEVGAQDALESLEALREDKVIVVSTNVWKLYLFLQAGSVYQPSKTYPIAVGSSGAVVCSPSETSLSAGAVP